MANFVPGRYYLSTSDSLALIAHAKNSLLAEHPELKPFQNEIGSYIARAVESRNERGITRAGTFREDEAAQERYFAELSTLAEREAQRCIRRFRDRAIALTGQKNKKEDATTQGGTVIKDFDTMPIRW